MTDERSERSGRRRTSEEAWEALEAERDADEAERLMALSDAELDAEVGKDPVDPAALRAAGVKTAREASHAAGNVVSLRPRRSSRPPPPRSWVPWLAAAAIVLLFLAFAYDRRGQIEAWFHSDSIGPDPYAPAPTRVAGDTPQQEAARKRAEARAACDAQDWGQCEFRLNEAEGLDPAGESDPAVKLLRKRILDGTTPDASDKPRRR